mmetsp:Transcript_43106/g.41446  ORF Transcript_43106/g.41446 Transcript_43106/m.41446 type:complete len:144 (+) Transcript_43106:858-1289(+)
MGQIPTMVNQNIQMNFQGNNFQQMPNNSSFQFSSSGGGTQVFFNQNSQPNSQYNVYGVPPEELFQEEEELPSPEQIKEIINSYNAFKYDAKSGEEHSCAICLENLKVGCMVKALQCTHQFHSKCINNWLKLKLKCPLCKLPVT